MFAQKLLQRHLRMKLVLKRSPVKGCGNSMDSSIHESPTVGWKKVNYPENTTLYLNQAYLTVKKIKRIYICDFFTLEQIVEAANPPEDNSTYVLKENEVKMIRPKSMQKQVSSWVCMRLSDSWLSEDLH